MRTTRAKMLFSHPFKLKGQDTPFAPGTYEVVVDEELIPALLFEGWRRVATKLRVPSLEAYSGLEQYLDVDAADLKAAHAADAVSSSP